MVDFAEVVLDVIEPIHDWIDPFQDRIYKSEGYGFHPSDSTGCQGTAESINCGGSVVTFERPCPSVVSLVWGATTNLRN